jgi:uncharacterized protein
MAPNPPPPPRDRSVWRLPRLRIDRDGVWLHEGEEVTHPGILDDLRHNLRVDAEGHYVQAGGVRVPVEVEDAPYVLSRVEAEGDELIVTLSDDSRERLAVDTLRFDSASVPYCRVKEGRFVARLSRAATYQLLLHAQYDESKRAAVLVVGRVRHEVPGLLA